MFRDFPAEHSVMTTGNLGKGTVRESGSLHGDKEVRFTQAGHKALGWLLLNTRRQSLLPTESTNQLRQVEGSAGLDAQDPPEEGVGGGAAVGIQAQRCQTSDLSSEPDIEISRLCILNLPSTYG